ncbi:MAG: universal stress protein [Croceitalea sp.]|nr:universal stress protein [Croceitalea sp.]
MIKQVLLPTDFSKNALNAIRYALDLYSDIRCEFYLLHAFQASGYTLDSMRVPEPGEPHYEAAKKRSLEGMAKLKQMVLLHGQNPNHTLHTISTFNSLVEAVRNTIAKKDIEIIFMGTKGVTGSKARIFGTNTVAIMEAIKNCPVLAIPEHYSFAPPKKIVFPTDYKTAYKKKEMEPLLEIAKLHNAKIDVIHIDKEKDGKLSAKQAANQELLTNILDQCSYSLHFLSEVKISKGITLFIESQKSDMIAFLNKKHLFFGSILSNPLVKEIGYEPTIPILELNDNSKRI